MSACPNCRAALCCLKLGADMDLPPELLEELLPPWPDGWATSDEPAPT